MGMKNAEKITENLLSESGDFASALHAYIAFLKKTTDATYAKQYSNLVPPAWSVDMGSKYVRIVKRDGQNMVHSFVGRADGNIWKAKSWKAPELNHPRGNVFKPESYSTFNHYGTPYLR